MLSNKRYREELITSEVCVRCGGCCSTYVERDSLSVVLVNSETNLELLDIVGCKHLKSDGNSHICGNYSERPDVCREYSCLEKANRLGLELKDDDQRTNRIKLAVAFVHGTVIECNSSGGDNENLHKGQNCDQADSDTLPVGSV